MSHIILNVISDDKVVINPIELYKILESSIEFYKNYPTDDMSSESKSYYKGMSESLKYHLNSIRKDIEQVTESKKT